jgi:hypothetical protein
MFGEWYQKTNKTEDTNKLTLLAFKIIAILHNTLLVMFIKLLETVIKDHFLNRLQNSCHTFLDCRHVYKTCAFHDALQAGKQRIPQAPDQGITVNDGEQVSLLSQELVDTDRKVWTRVIVQQHPLDSPVQLWSNTVDAS